MNHDYTRGYQPPAIAGECGCTLLQRSGPLQRQNPSVEFDEFTQGGSSTSRSRIDLDSCFSGFTSPAPRAKIDPGRFKTVFTRYATLEQSLWTESEFGGVGGISIMSVGARSRRSGKVVGVVNGQTWQYTGWEVPCGMISRMDGPAWGER